MTVLSLAQLTVCGVRPVELVEIAAQADYGAISPFLGIAGSSDLFAVPLRAGDPETVAMARRLKETGVIINIADGFAIYDDVPMDELRAGVTLMAEMGARALNTILFDSDDSRGFDRFCQLREWAAEAKVDLLIEFTPLSRVAGLHDALAYRERAGGDNIALLVDQLHLHHSGGTPADLKAIDQALIRGVQVCDGLREATRDEYFDQAIHQRMIPGEGELPVRDLLAVVPRDLIIDVEVPLRSLEQAGVDHLFRAKRVADATRKLLAEIS